MTNPGIEPFMPPGTSADQCLVTLALPQVMTCPASFYVEISIEQLSMLHLHTFTTSSLASLISTGSDCSSDDDEASTLQATEMFSNM
jgi:hypothetical protein